MAGNSQRVKLLMAYDVIPEKQDEYFQYVLGEFVPAVQHLGLYMTEAWHTAYGDYPVRLASFVAEDLATAQSILESAAFQRLETKLREYVTNYSKRLVPLREDHFQF